MSNEEKEMPSCSLYLRTKKLLDEQNKERAQQVEKIRMNRLMRKLLKNNKNCSYATDEEAPQRN
jgi:hypothetical protein